MAKLKSLLKIEGTLDDITFYKSEDGYLVRQKGGVSKNRIKNDPAFARTRENNAEFGYSASAGKTFRQAITPLLFDAKDAKVTSRVTKVMTQLKNLDTTSVRGQRQASIGLQTTAGKELLKDFEFNLRATIDSILFTDINLDTATGVITLVNLNPSQQIAKPTGATHVSFYGAMLNLDLDTGEKSLEISNTVNIPIDTTVQTVTLTPAVATGSGLSFYFLKVAFFQELNGAQYPLNNGAFNALKLLEVI
ncbi:hypothetical protein DFQ05_0317 [Winogradskyella wandonensis]|uniref:Uncharacterized protein n=1 Tax=Winogradskyella wandonensis TaxID=1442586 RepID=A0A4R1KVR2_9FLAO|nr:hypothetical protein [Winogradskyella wandonensis]TCK68807.1 hypothetical protein DFQ05_0317 [Winogradskyella wandonensis]